MAAMADKLTTHFRPKKTVGITESD